MAVQQLADERGRQLTKLIDDQLEELGGDQTLDYVSLNRKVIDSGIKFGLGVLEGPFVRTEQKCGWSYDSRKAGTFQPTERDTCYKPQFSFVPVWDFYPDMSGKRSLPGDGYFIRKIMGRSVTAQARRSRGFLRRPDQEYLWRPTKAAAITSRGQFRDAAHVRSGTKANVSDTPIDAAGQVRGDRVEGPGQRRQADGARCRYQRMPRRPTTSRLRSG
jgi:hypothetical protein